MLDVGLCDTGALGFVLSCPDALAELHKAYLALPQYLGDRLVREGVGGALDFLSERLHLILEVPNSRLHRYQHLGQTLVLETGPLQASGGVGQLILKRINHLPVLPPAHPGVLDLLAMRLDLLSQLAERLDLALVFPGHADQVLSSALLRNDLLNNLVHIGHPRGLLDFAEGIFKYVDFVARLDLFQLDGLLRKAGELPLLWGIRLPPAAGGELVAHAFAVLHTFQHLAP
mmetsp:Transcript_6879/g.15094  ORF Transcript_6879/g.15094 Transcript_6879/m.15094 type:complete len:230 (+) Transcript_6879:512-1201(+)